MWSEYTQSSSSSLLAGAAHLSMQVNHMTGHMSDRSLHKVIHVHQYLGQFMIKFPQYYNIIKMPYTLSSSVPVKSLYMYLIAPAEV